MFRGSWCCDSNKFCMSFCMFSFLWLPMHIHVVLYTRKLSTYASDPPKNTDLDICFCPYEYVHTWGSIIVKFDTNEKWVGHSTLPSRMFTRLMIKNPAHISFQRNIILHWGVFPVCHLHLFRSWHEFPVFSFASDSPGNHSTCNKPVLDSQHPKTLSHLPSAPPTPLPVYHSLNYHFYHHYHHCNHPRKLPSKEWKAFGLIYHPGSWHPEFIMLRWKDLDVFPCQW